MRIKGFWIVHGTPVHLSTFGQYFCLPITRLMTSVVLIVFLHMSSECTRCTDQYTTYFTCTFHSWKEIGKLFSFHHRHNFYHHFLHTYVEISQLPFSFLSWRLICSLRKWAVIGFLHFSQFLWNLFFECFSRMCLFQASLNVKYTVTLFSHKNTMCQ